MTTLSEGNLQIKFPAAAKARKFDDSTHGLSHCMKAVDFIVELKDRYWFIEFKDPQKPGIPKKERDQYAKRFLSGIIDEDFKYKYRDSFFYQWAAKRTDKPVYYFVLVALDSLTDADLLSRTDAMKQKLPLQGPASGAWKRSPVAGCSVFNIAAWNNYLSDYPVSRLR